MAMKHQSTWDTLILPIVLGDPACVLKRELLFVPFYGWYAARAGSISVDRKAGASALRRLVTAARPIAAQGRPIVIFPEGTRAGPGVRLAYQSGVAALYQALALPLVPAAVNSGFFWGRRSFVKRPGRIVLEFLEPIPPGRPRRAVMAELEQRIETATALLLREAEAALCHPIITGGHPSPDRHGWARGSPKVAWPSHKPEAARVRRGDERIRNLYTSRLKRRNP